MNDVKPSQNEGAQPALDDLLGTSSRQSWRKQITWASIFVLLLIFAYAAATSFSAPDAPPYLTAPVTRGAITATVGATGNLAPTNQVEVGSEQSGLVTHVYVDNNDRVTAGQPLARLDTARLRDEITQSRGALAQSQAQFAQAQATLAQARAQLARLEEVYRLSGGKVPSRVELDIGRAENARAVAALRTAQAQVMQSRAALSTAQTNLSKATIYSPVSGVVLSRRVEPGQTVAASLSSPILFVIAEDLSRMKLQVRVDEADVGQVVAGQRATFTVDAFPGRVFPARVDRVDLGANATVTTGSGGSSAGGSNVVAYVATLSVANPNMILRPGMTATASIVTREQAGQLLVPNAALRFSPGAAMPFGMPGEGGMADPFAPSPAGGQTVYIVGPDGEPQAVPVTTGATDGSNTAVASSGLRPGMQVINGQLAMPQ